MTFFKASLNQTSRIFRASAYRGWNLMLLCSVFLSAASVQAQESFVRLIHANAFGVGYDSEKGSKAIFNGYIEVDSEYAEKQVSVVYREIGTNEWKVEKAQYTETTIEGRENWFFRIQDIYYDFTQGKDAQIQFAVVYRKNGVDYWDNNQGDDYWLGVGPNLGRQFVLGEPAVFVKNAGVAKNSSGQCFLSADIVLKNLALEKDVAVVFTVDNWETTLVRKAKYREGPFLNNNSEDWQIRFFVPQGLDVEFAVAYNVNGVTYWDNNFGENYRLEDCSDYLFW